MKASKKAYKAKCKRRYIDFYLHEKYLYDFSKMINFNQLVKKALEAEFAKWQERNLKNG